MACPEDEAEVRFSRGIAGRREVRISSLIYTEHRERSDSKSKLKRKGLSLVSAERSRESSASKSRKEYAVRTESSFMDINDSIIVKIKDKENQPQSHPPIQIRQP